MSKIIAELWRGNIDPVSCSGVGNEEIKYLTKIKVKNHENLENILDDDAKVLFDKYIESSNEYVSALLEEAFCDGFGLGTKITAEALMSANEK